MKINVHAGHNPDGKTACGAVGLIKESTEARRVKNKVIALLKAEGHTVHDCTVNNGINQSDVLNKIISKCNAHKVDLDISIHFNAGAEDEKGNGKTTGTEVLLYSSSSKAKAYAERTLKEIEALGFKTRGIKYRTDLGFLRRTVSPAMLIECCFVDDKDDVIVYDYKQMAKAIVEGILEKKIGVTVRAKEKVAFRSDTITGKETFVEWIKKGDKALYISSLIVGKTVWMKVEYSGKVGYVVRSKMIVEY